ncbi:hypothetical protein ACFQZS_08180 [Mucilaginibacter calamicampi]|uniref:CCDC81-like prokaryotic HU domain-containing protein n=1 Tax=Mucilaginibacter calamicampi TaxID=1302352 RepID=A0ABW2YX18_9SPHI
MDVGFYLGELLMLRGEVKVSGLGNFSQVRMSAYYDENEATFYPPYNKVHFEAQADIDDDALAAYLVAKKSISLTSAKYFIEKYISNLRLQAIVADVPLGNLGYFYTDRAELSFKPVDKLSNDLEVYGYAPIKINKTHTVSARQHEPWTETLLPPQNPETLEADTAALYTEPVVEEQIEPVAEEQIEPIAEEKFEPIAERFEPVAEQKFEPVTEEKFDDPITSSYDEVFSDLPEETIEAPVSPTYDEAFLDLPEEEEEERRGPLRGILITLIILAVLGAGVVGLYMYAPDTFNKLQFWKNAEPAVPAETRPNTIVIPELDSLNTDTAKNALNDSAGIAATDTVAKSRFELISGKGFKNLWAADKAVKKYKAMGIPTAKLAEDMPGNYIKVSLGTFRSVSESEAMRQKLIKEKNLSKGSYTLEIINK